VQRLKEQAAARQACSIREVEQLRREKGTTDVVDVSLREVAEEHEKGLLVLLVFMLAI
jgi:hypothetical protein